MHIAMLKYSNQRVASLADAVAFVSFASFFSDGRRWAVNFRELHQSCQMALVALLA